MPKSAKIFTQTIVQRINEMRAKQDKDLETLVKTQTNEAITETTKRLRKVEKDSPKHFKY